MGLDGWLVQASAPGSERASALEVALWLDHPAQVLAPASGRGSAAALGQDSVGQLAVGWAQELAAWSVGAWASGSADSSAAWLVRARAE